MELSLELPTWEIRDYMYVETNIDVPVAVPVHVQL